MKRNERRSSKLKIQRRQKIFREFNRLRLPGMNLVEGIGSRYNDQAAGGDEDQMGGVERRRRLFSDAGPSMLINPSPTQFTLHALIKRQLAITIIWRICCDFSGVNHPLRRTNVPTQTSIVLVKFLFARLSTSFAGIALVTFHTFTQKQSSKCSLLYFAKSLVCAEFFRIITFREKKEKRKGKEETFALIVDDDWLKFQANNQTVGSNRRVTFYRTVF